MDNKIDWIGKVKQLNDEFLACKATEDMKRWDSILSITALLCLSCTNKTDNIEKEKEMKYVKLEEDKREELINYLEKASDILYDIKKYFIDQNIRDVMIPAGNLGVVYDLNNAVNLIYSIQKDLKRGDVYRKGE